MHATSNDVSYAAHPLTYMPLAETTQSRALEVHSRMQAFARRRCRGDAEEARLLRDGYDTRVWLAVGDPGYGAYIERVLGYTGRTQRERLRVALALRNLQQLEQAMENGELFWSQVRELTRIVTPMTEAVWLEEAKNRSPAEVQRMVTGRGEGDLPSAPSRLENIRHFSVTRSRRAHLRAFGRRVACWKKSWGTRSTTTRSYRCSPIGSSRPARVRKRGTRRIRSP